MTATASPHVAAPDAIRAHFPSLSRKEGANPVAYFDGPGGTQVPRPVVEAMNEYLYHHNANTHWSYPTSTETDEAIAEARLACADFLNAAPNEVSFGQNMTTITFHLARALGRTLGRGDEIIVTELDHHANVAPWRALEKERGVTVRMVRMDPATGLLDLADLEQKLTARTKVLAIGAASNALGTITDVARTAKMARAASKGVTVFVDAVHYAPHQLVDVRAFDCDYLACSAYKFYGPHIGILYGRHDLLNALDVPKLDPAPELAPERMETGTQNHEGIVGASAAVDFIEMLAPDAGAHRRERLTAAMSELHHRGEKLFKRLWDGLGAIKGITRFGPAPGTPRTPTVSFVVKGTRADDVATALVKHGVYCSSGDFYATTIIERLGQAKDGVVRAGCSCYSTMDEVERLLSGLEAIAK